jgi:hypothetical protein
VEEEELTLKSIIPLLKNGVHLLSLFEEKLS